MDHIDWNRGLLLGCLLITIGGMGAVAARSVRDRLLALGVLVQGVAIVLLTGGGFFFRDEFDLASAGLLVVFCFWGAWFIPLPKKGVRVNGRDTPSSANESQVSG